MGDLSFQNNVPDPLLAGKELPSFKFELDKSKGKVLGKSFGKEITVEQLPISKGIASALSEGHRRTRSENKAVWNIGAGRMDHVLKIRLETEPCGNLDLICCLKHDFVA